MSEYVRSLERGLAVIRSFGSSTRGQRIADVAKSTGLNPATARRLIMTLEKLDYVRHDDGRFMLAPRILELGYAYLASSTIPDLAVPYLERLSSQVNESCSVAVLDGADITYIARVPGKRIMTVSIGLGSRFPAYKTSLGRVLLAGLPNSEIAQVWDASDRSQPTQFTVAQFSDLMARIEEVRENGWAMVNQELELGVRSLAAPVTNSTGQWVAAVNLSTHVSRTDEAELLESFLPQLLSTAADLSRALASHPAGASRTSTVLSESSGNTEA